MNELIYNALAVIFDSTLAKDVSEFLQTVMNGLINIFSNSEVSQYITIFSAVGASLMIIFFFIHMTDMASKDMMTLERLTLAFVKLIIGFCIMIFLPEIIRGLFTFVSQIYVMASGMEIKTSNLGITEFFGEPAFPSKFNKDTMNFVKGGAATNVLNNLSIMFFSMLVTVGGWVARFAAYFIAVSNAIMLIGRAIFAPISVAQCFDEGERSNAVKNLKKFAADGLVLAIIAVLLYAGGILNANISSSILQEAGISKLTVTTAKEIIGNYKLLATVLVVNFSCIGAIMKGHQIAQDIVGTH